MTMGAETIGALLPVEVETLADVTVPAPTPVIAVTMGSAGGGTGLLSDELAADARCRVEIEAYE